MVLKEFVRVSRNSVAAATSGDANVLGARLPLLARSKTLATVRSRQIVRLSLALDVYAGSLSLVCKIRGLHRLCCLADLKFDAIVLKEIYSHCCDPRDFLQVNLESA
jgi:hypothetical protein